jgi:hypothetical protein
VTSCPPKSNHHRADCQISILYNRQISLCDSSSSSASAAACRDPEALCTADPDFSFTTPADEETTIIRVEDLAGHRTKQQGRRRRLVTQSQAGFKGSFPLLATVGDFNIDGYPDLLIVTADEHNPKDKRAQILESVPCSGVGGGVDGAGGAGAIVGCGGGGGGGKEKKERRGFRLVTSGAEALEQIDDVESAHWVDLDDDVSGGTLSLSLPLVLSFLSAAPPATARRRYPFLRLEKILTSTSGDSNFKLPDPAGHARHSRAAVRRRRRQRRGEATLVYQKQLLPRCVLPQSSR